LQRSGFIRGNGVLGNGLGRYKRSKALGGNVNRKGKPRVGKARVSDLKIAVKKWQGPEGKSYRKRKTVRNKGYDWKHSKERRTLKGVGKDGDRRKKEGFPKAGSVRAAGRGKSGKAINDGTDLWRNRNLGCS